MVSKRYSTHFFIVLFSVLGLIATYGIKHIQGEINIIWCRWDIIYFVVAIVLSVLSFFVNNDIEDVRRGVYTLSIIFFFAFLFFDVKVACLGTISFFIPALLFQKKLINVYVLTLVSIIAAILLWYTFGYLLILPLYMPICMLVAQKTTTGFQVRFTKNAHDNKNILSLKQQKMRNFHQRGIFERFLAHLDNIVSTAVMLGENEDGNQDMNFNELYGAKLLKLQDSQTMSEALTAIRKRDAKFNPDDMLEYSGKIFKKIMNSWYEQRIETIEHFVSDALYEQFKHQISDQIEAGIKYQCRKLEFIDHRIAFADSDDNFDYIVVFVRATTLDSLVDAATNSILVANAKPRALVEYWTFIRRPGANTLDLSVAVSNNCPNCGTPIVIGHATICSSCNSFLRSGEYNWVLSKITQASEWEYLKPSLIPGWQQLKQEDNFFTLQSAEDLASVIFWKLRLAQKSNNLKLLSRFANNEICNGLKRVKSRSLQAGSYLEEAFNDADYMEDVVLASVRLKAIVTSDKETQLYLLIVWSGVPVKVDKNKIIQDFVRVNCIVKDVYVLSRIHGAKSNIAHAITSAHCHNCGASSESGFSNFCTYCDTLLNDENNAWVLQKLLTDKDLEYRNLVGKIIKQPVDKSRDSLMSATDIITVLAQVMIADQRADVEEITLLKKMAEKYAISNEKVNAIVKNLQQGMIYIPTPEGGSQAMKILSSAIEMALADGKIDESEKKIILSLGKHLGQSKRDINLAIHMQESK